MLSILPQWIGPELAKWKLPVSLTAGREPSTRVAPTASAIIFDVATGEPQLIARPEVVTNRQDVPTRGVVKRHYIREYRCQALFLARSTKAGARHVDHVDLLDALIDAFLVAADEAVRANQNLFSPEAGTYLRPEDQTEDALQNGYAENGARYLLTFRVARPVFGRPAPTTTIVAAPADPPALGAHFVTTLKVPFGGTDWTTVTPAPEP